MTKPMQPIPKNREQLEDELIRLSNDKDPKIRLKARLQLAVEEKLEGVLQNEIDQGDLIAGDAVLTYCDVIMAHMLSQFLSRLNAPAPMLVLGAAALQQRFEQLLASCVEELAKGRGGKK